MLKTEDKIKEDSKELYFDIQELDRKRIARDLHDTSLQNLASLIHRLELASMYIDRDVIQAKLELALISKSINSIIEEIRNTIFDLRPMTFDDLGLKEAVEQICDKLKESFDITISLDLDEIVVDDHDSIKESMMLALFRIIQESIQNICKHSKAKRMSVVLKNRSDEIILEIKDDGIGFDLSEAKKKERHFGLLILEERVKLLGGNLIIETAPGKGTKINVVIPKQK
ncbi:MAG: sensor histidine kinase [Lachnospiraceae bacterium]|nr:sensor histidine kinase [Lachnospiraceae bacterium]